MVQVAAYVERLFGSEIHESCGGQPERVNRDGMGGRFTEGEGIRIKIKIRKWGVGHGPSPVPTSKFGLF